MAHTPLNIEKFSSILLFGLPGSGKGLIGKMLSSAGTQLHLSSTDIFHAESDRVSDETFIDLWKGHVDELIINNAYNPDTQDLLLEGLPRTLSQAQLLQKLINVRHIIVLEISDENELLERLRKQTSDFDNDHLRAYSKQMEEVLSFYPPHLISRVDASQKPLEVIRDVLVRLSHLLSHGPKNKVN